MITLDLTHFMKFERFFMEMSAMCCMLQTFLIFIFIYKYTLALFICNIYIYFI